MKQRYLILLPFIILLLGGSNAPILHSFDVKKLSGNIHLTLKHGVWKLWEEKPVYQNITLDLVCDQGKCEPEVWGYAKKFNQDVDHQGALEINNLEKLSIEEISTKQYRRAWELKITINIQSHPWSTEILPAVYKINLVPYKNQIIGSYQGKYKQKKLQGSVTGIITKAWPANISDHLALSPQEHPRLVFRKHQLSSLQEATKTPEGQAIIKQLEKILEQPIYYDGYVPTGGYHASGYCFLALINNDKELANMGWKIVEKSLENPGRRLLEHSPIVAGVALAYDFCYSVWDQKQINTVTNWLGAQTKQLVKGDSSRNGWNSNAGSNWNARARGAAGLAALAILNEPGISNDEIYHLMRTAERNIKRYLSTAIGNRGFGSEGDHYTTEPLILTIFPFLQAYSNVIGKDLVEGSRLQWILPHYLMRMIPNNNQLNVTTYGRHRYYAGSDLLATGLVTLPEDFLPAVVPIFEKSLGLKGDQTFGINMPHYAPFILSFYDKKHNLSSKNPVQLFGYNFVDQQKGFYNFRNQWINQDDFVANIFLKKELIGGTWHYPDVGSFRISGLGETWAKAGKSSNNWQEENVVILPKSSPWKTSKPLFFVSNTDGSGIVTLQTNTNWRKNSEPPVGIAGLRSFAVDYSQSSGVPGLFVLVDRFLGNNEAEEFKEKVWIMHTAGNVTVKDNSFLIKGKNKTTMKGTFVVPESVKVTTEKTEEGTKIVATGGQEFFVIMTVQKKSPPPLTIKGLGMDAKVTVGKQKISFDQDRIRLSTINP
ncbi:MAG: hypothetical protein MK111_12715 [Crocosphaera sp.]|uniref:Heparinase II N-terminal domain-containing protein n=2 Tax=Crocosphaera watsonii TaxID=263511 RepID=G5JA64_CROWT|nr:MULTISPECIES: hypothetical protein [Crocosphaera]EHJ10925.1 hypothetical protein CWATWH0003_4326 [Crocosphaera watsonii WH 0003]MCH2245485.1 hypothetical protein [Crocosphaera sp.]CCQ54623.1 hypothetical protein CWATWH0005_3542 [Crocosphaera watsonii WH 0005]